MSILFRKNIMIMTKARGVRLKSFMTQRSDVKLGGQKKYHSFILSMCLVKVVLAGLK